MVFIPLSQGGQLCPKAQRGRGSLQEGRCGSGLLCREQRGCGCCALGTSPALLLEGFVLLGAPQSAQPRAAPTCGPCGIMGALWGCAAGRRNGHGIPGVSMQAVERMCASEHQQGLGKGQEGGILQETGGKWASGIEVIFLLVTISENWPSEPKLHHGGIEISRSILGIPQLLCWHLGCSILPGMRDTVMRDTVIPCYSHRTPCPTPWGGRGWEMNLGTWTKSLSGLRRGGMWTVVPGALRPKSPLAPVLKSQAPIGTQGCSPPLGGAPAGTHCSTTPGEGTRNSHTPLSHASCMRLY